MTTLWNVASCEACGQQIAWDDDPHPICDRCLRRRYAALLAERDRLHSELLQRDMTWLPAKDAEIDRLRAAAAMMLEEAAGDVIGVYVSPAILALRAALVPASEDTNPRGPERPPLPFAGME